MVVNDMVKPRFTYYG